MDSILDESTPEYPIDSWKILRDQTRTGRDRAIDCVDSPLLESIVKHGNNGEWMNGVHRFMGIRQ